MQEPTEGELLLKRCLDSIAGMDDSRTTVVDADDCSTSTIESVTAQLEDQGWGVEISPAEGDGPAQFIISAPAEEAVDTNIPAAGRDPQQRRHRPRGARSRQPRRARAGHRGGGENDASRNRAAEVAQRRSTAFEQADPQAQQSSAPSSMVTFTASKKAILIAMIVIVVFAALWFLYISPRRQLDELAQDTCDDLDGSIMLVAAATLGSAVEKAERLGFSGPELGERMREKCPSIMTQIEEFASRY